MLFSVFLFGVVPRADVGFRIWVGRQARRREHQRRLATAAESFQTEVRAGNLRRAYESATADFRSWYGSADLPETVGAAPEIRNGTGCDVLVNHSAEGKSYSIVMTNPQAPRGTRASSSVSTPCRRRAIRPEWSS